MMRKQGFEIIILALILNLPGSIGRAEEAAPASAAASIAPAVVPKSAPIVWQEWSTDIFQKSAAEKRFVILDLEAVWCHWCHVMDETTYQDPRVISLIQTHYLPVRVDQDSHPELSNRYEDYGWPATIVFGPDGKEIVKRRGYLSPDLMASLLQAIIDDPTPGPSVLPEVVVTPATDSFLQPEQIEHLKEAHQSFYDAENGGWGNLHKLIDSDNLEYSIREFRSGNKQEERMALQTLDGALNLLDREWGGFFQYSDQPNWKSPHYEKIMIIQSQYMRLYALAYSIWGKQEYLDAARKTAAYMREFMTSPEGSFYTSQDADISPEKTGSSFYSLPDTERRKIEMPAIDKHIYARENGWMISALAQLYDVTGEDEYLTAALRSSEAIFLERSLPEGGFRHDEKDAAGPYLGDSLAMAQAFLRLYISTTDRNWLRKSQETVSYIEKNFRHPEAGYVTSAAGQSAFQSPVRQVDENIALARLGNLLKHYSGQSNGRQMAEHAMRFLASNAIIDNRRFITGILLVDQELQTDPVHIVIVGPKNEAQAKSLYQAGLRYPAVYKRIEWWDKKEGPLPNADVTYPEMEKSAAYPCVNGTCSFPVFDPDKLASKLDRLNMKRAE